MARHPADTSHRFSQIRSCAMLPASHRPSRPRDASGGSAGENTPARGGKEAASAALLGISVCILKWMAKNYREGAELL